MKKTMGIILAVFALGLFLFCFWPRPMDRLVDDGTGVSAAVTRMWVEEGEPGMEQKSAVFQGGSPEAAGIREILSGYQYRWTVLTLWDEFLIRTGLMDSVTASVPGSEVIHLFDQKGRSILIVSTGQMMVDGRRCRVGFLGTGRGKELFLDLSGYLKDKAQ